MANSKVFFYFCISFVLGIFLNSFFSINQVVSLGFLIVALMFISIFWTRWKMVIIGFCILFFVLGVSYHQKAEMQIINSELQDYNDAKQEIILTGIVSQEVDVRDNNIKLTINQINSLKNPAKFIKGKVLIIVDRYPEYQYGDKLEIKGKLQTPQVFDEFNYQDYLKKDGIYSVIYYPEIKLIEKDQANIVFSSVLNFKNKLRKVIYQNLSPPQSSILAAIILGDKRQISQEWKEKLNYSGVRHLTAISGMHIVILTVILMKFLINLGFWQKQAFYLTIILIFSFIVITGCQSSAIRAGVMAGFLLLAQYLGRFNISIRAIVFAAVLMLAFNPLILKLDIGFQLSFLATLSIIYFLPVFQFFLRRMPDFFQLKNILCLTLAAQVFVLPILIYNFGYFSIIALITNLLIVPLLPFIMILGFIFILIGIVSSFLAWLLSFPLWLVLSYLTKIVDLFAGFSFSAVFLNVSWFYFLFYYLILIVFLWRFNQKNKTDF